MACRGVHFAIRPETMSRLLEAKTDSAVLGIVQEDMEQRWEEEWLHQVDKSWDALHRCLGDGTLAIPQEFVPLPAAILGGVQLYTGNDYIISLVTCDKVRLVADALATVTKDWLRQRYDEPARL